MSKTASSEYKLGAMMRRRLRVAAGLSRPGAAPRWVAAPAGAQTAADASGGWEAGPAVNAVWVEHEFTFTYFGRGHLLLVRRPGQQDRVHPRGGRRPPGAEGAGQLPRRHGRPADADGAHQGGRARRGDARSCWRQLADGQVEARTGGARAGQGRGGRRRDSAVSRRTAGRRVRWAGAAAASRTATANCSTSCCRRCWSRWACARPPGHRA